MTPWEVKAYQETEEREAEDRQYRQENAPDIAACAVAYGQEFYWPGRGVFVRVRQAFDNSEVYVYGTQGHLLVRVAADEKVKRRVD
jgi:hypothetical protein